MMDGISVRVDDEMLASVCRVHRVRELALFGSALREDFTGTSDVDVLVEFLPDSEVNSLFDFIRFKHELEDHVFHREVDLVEKDTLSPYIADHVLKGRRILYAAA